MKNKKKLYNFSPSKVLLILFSIIFSAEVTVMLAFNTVVSDKVPPWGFAALDGLIMSAVSLLTIYFMNAKSIININNKNSSEIIILKVGAIIFSIEATIMFLLALPGIELLWWEELIVDSLSLSILTVGLIYITIIRPSFYNDRNDIKRTIRDSLIANIIVFVSFALLVFLIFYIVYNRSAEQSQVMANTLTVLYGLFLLISGFIIFLLNSSTTNNIIKTEQINKLANFDQLTNLGNRRYFENTLKAKLVKSSLANKKVALMFLDLDKFKPINDTYGHDIGDLTLQETANKILQCIRQDDIACRLGGDEFAIILPLVDNINSAETIAKRILAKFNELIKVNKLEFSIGISIGISLSADNETKLNLVKKADKAMYDAKKASGNTYKIS